MCATLRHVLLRACAVRTVCGDHLSLTRHKCPRELTPWSRVSLEKLLVVRQLLKKSPPLWKSNVYYHVHKSPLLYPILSQLNPVHILSPFYFEIHFNNHRSVPRSYEKPVHSLLFNKLVLHRFLAFHVPRPTSASRSLYISKAFDQARASV
jgi:hypothetical protein